MVALAYCHHVTAAVTARRPRAGRTLQVPRAVLRARLRLFRDRQLGRMAILSQFMKEGKQKRDLFLRFFLLWPGESKTSDFLFSQSTPTPMASYPSPFIPSFPSAGRARNARFCLT